MSSSQRGQGVDACLDSRLLGVSICQLELVCVSPNPCQVACGMPDVVTFGKRTKNFNIFTKATSGMCADITLCCILHFVTAFYATRSELYLLLLVFMDCVCLVYFYFTIL